MLLRLLRQPVERGRDPGNALFVIASVHSATHSYGLSCTVFIDSVFITIPSSYGDELLYMVRGTDVRTLNMSVDYSHLEFSRPAKHVKTINVEPVPQRIFDGMAKYEDAARGYNLLNFERSIKDKAGELIPTQLLVTHRPPDAQVLQIYRLSTDPSATDLQRITYFDIGAGRTIPVFLPIIGEDWRGIWRGGGAIMAMDADGNEMFQLWYV